MQGEDMDPSVAMHLSDYKMSDIGFFPKTVYKKPHPCAGKVAMWEWVSNLSITSSLLQTYVAMLWLAMNFVRAL